MYLRKLPKSDDAYKNTSYDFLSTYLNLNFKFSFLSLPLSFARYVRYVYLQAGNLQVWTLLNLFFLYFLCLSLYINPVNFRQQDIVDNLNSSFIILINSLLFLRLISPAETKGSFGGDFHLVFKLRLNPGNFVCHSHKGR